MNKNAIFGKRWITVTRCETGRLREELMHNHKNSYKVTEQAILLLLVCFFVAARVAWILYTHHTFEDAFITFRYAENVARGNGYVYNIGEHVYGSTTPLFTFLLALWVLLFPGQIVIGAWFYNLVTSTLAVVFLWKILGILEISKEQRIVTLLVLAVTGFLISKETEGMEMSLVLCLMSLSLYLLVLHKDTGTGIVLGLLLWARIDGIFWVGALICLELYISHHIPFKMMFAAALIYLPWITFATFYFGSPVPQAIYAKLFSFSVNAPPLPIQIKTSISIFPLYLLVFAPIGVFANSHNKWLTIFPAFFVFEILRLTVLKETFDARYFVPAYWVGSILMSFGFYAVWRYVRNRFSLSTWSGILLLASYLGMLLFFTVQDANERRDYQKYVYTDSTKVIGMWLNQNTAKDSVVLLEPLGYVGYYSQRHILDEVSLVTPQMIPVRQKVLSIYYAISVFKPNYVINHCDDALKINKDSYSFLEHYRVVFKTNPLGFDPLHPMGTRIPRNACYLVWRRE
jgi:hypothetical protein